MATLFGAISIAILVLIYLYSLILVPARPRIPYFPSTGFGRLSQVNWTISRFQPIFLRSYKSNGELFINTAHRNSKGWIEFTNINLGSADDEKKQTLLLDSSENTTLQAEISKLKFGNRIAIGYFNSTTHRPGTPSEHASKYDDRAAIRLCENVPYFCVVAKVTTENNDAYWSFEYSGQLKTKGPLYSVYFSNQTTSL